MSKLFNNTQFSKPKRNLFDLSHERKLTMNMGDLVPILLHEVVPGDKFRVNTESFIRFAPLLAPIMHRVNAYIHFYYVPNRILFDGWETFITGGEDGKQTAAMPTITFQEPVRSQIEKGTLADYFGLPVPGATFNNGFYINALPFRAYQTIYNEYYRDQNLQPKVEVLKTAGDLTTSEQASVTTLRKRAWEKDYFTSSLPWSQRGDEVLLPTINEVTYSNPSKVTDSAGGDAAGGPLSVGDGSQAGNLVSSLLSNSQIRNIEDIQTQITINDLRRSARLQEFLEKTARGGSRLTEVVKAFFGVTSSDARLQRPEFLGGGKVPVNISSVLSTFDSAETPGGQMYGHAQAVGNTNRFSRFFEEHGWIIGIMSVLPRTAYQNGVPKHFLKRDKFDLYWPTFAQLGEQEVQNIEVYHDFTEPADYATFGYQSRYAEYKHAQSSVHGDFRDQLDFWHMGRKFATKPALNSEFITSSPREDIFAVTDPDVHKLYVQIYNDVKAMRPMPYFNNPIL